MRYWTYENLCSGVAVPERILGIAGRTLRSFEPYVTEPRLRLVRIGGHDDQCDERAYEVRLELIPGVMIDVEAGLLDCDDSDSEGDDVETDVSLRVEETLEACMPHVGQLSDVVHMARLAAGSQGHRTRPDRTLSAVGITFRQIDGTTLNSKATRRRNVRRAYCDRFTKVSETHEAAVRDMLAADGKVPLGRIHAILANDPRTAQQLVHALLCRRVLSYDLDLPTDPNTPVRPVKASPAWVDIRNLNRSEAA